MNLYFEASKTLDGLDARIGSIKGVLATLPEKDRKRISALVIETLKYKAVLTQVINETNLLKDERKKITSMNLALVLVHDILLAGGIQAGDGPIKQAILRHKTRLNGEFQRIKIKRGARSNLELAHNGDDRAAQIPRYVRVNTLIWTSDHAMDAFISNGYNLMDPFTSSRGFAKDEHIPNLLLFSPQTTFHDDPVYKSGKIILQDKASCFPAVVLSPPSREDVYVIDATAAPGNKTSHLSAIMGNKGKLFAFERDRKRFKTLQMMLSKAGCQNVEALNLDFLTVDPQDAAYRKVTHILLDPSCSGSGIVNRLDHLLETEEESKSEKDERLTKLAAFQLVMIKHAMKFPAVKRIVYSTCSVHAMENEHVVRDALKSEEAESSGFKLESLENVLPQWKRRGLPDEMDNPGDAASLIRCSPGGDATNGFFVSCFVRRDRNTTNDQKRRSDEELSAVPRKKKKKKNHNS
ncbi:S-adenosyl-L-methionine-dependent methyltransferase [Guyanagaster necrorhizus]|uniref:S-adenosyl-L-methionine-dependent methyltransferase n=1 Tax=Guyanagaster necrorhizus TaxID=856835 RepID=A0A9P8AXC5_9AGAR|nr:S-adenosyl-L-methionine-dependent methyltransferase [Guyanagaster necrorhizus MCA 3950]KAG7451071.1 S-adenosyl-L-methionine-dependent methyltransferase [Guyanagaster necrorhizus MCA 3950]